MSKADKRETKNNPNKKAPEITMSRFPRRHAKGGKFSTINQDVQHANAKWKRVLNAAGVDTGAIENKKTGTIMRCNRKDGKWEILSPNQTILTAAEEVAMEARRNAVPDPVEPGMAVISE